MRVGSGVVLAIVLTCPSTSVAQTTTEAAGPPRAFIDVNLLGVAKSASGGREFRSRFVTFGEAGFARANYPKPSSTALFPSIDVGAGYITGSLLGLGLNVSRVSFDDGASLTTSIPHPVYLNSPGTGDGATSRALKRHETAISAYVMAVPLRTSRAELRFFMGPTYFRIKAEMIKTVTYSQSATVTPLTNVITVTGFTSEDASGGGIGFHGGADFTYFFTKMFGVRGGIRYEHGHVTVKNEPLSGLEQTLTAGGPTAFLGARFRLGK